MIRIYLFFPGNKIFFGHLLKAVLDFGIIDAIVRTKCNEGSVEKVADRIHNDKDVSTDMGLAYSFKSSFVFFFDFIVLLTLFWNYSPKRNFCFFSKQQTLFCRSELTLQLSLNKGPNTLCLLKYDPLLWQCSINITHCSTNSNSLLRSMTPSLSFLRWSKRAQRRPSDPIIFAKFPCVFFSDLSEKI